MQAAAAGIVGRERTKDASDERLEVVEGGWEEIRVEQEQRGLACTFLEQASPLAIVERCRDDWRSRCGRGDDAACTSEGHNDRALHVLNRLHHEVAATAVVEHRPRDGATCGLPCAVNEEEVVRSRRE